MEKLFNELGFESLADRRWLRRLCFFFKIKHKSTPSYLHDILPISNRLRSSRRLLPHVHNFAPRTDTFSYSFFPNTIRDWNALDSSFCDSSTLSIFKKSLLKFIRPTPASIYGIHNPVGLKYLTRLRLSLSHLREHKFRHNFRGTINPLCPCNFEQKTTSHFLLRCSFFKHQKIVLFDSLEIIDPVLLNMTDSKLTNILLYGDEVHFSFESNASMIRSVIIYILSTERFSDNLL